MSRLDTQIKTALAGLVLGVPVTTLVTIIRQIFGANALRARGAPNARVRAACERLESVDHGQPRAAGRDSGAGGIFPTPAPKNSPTSRGSSGRSSEAAALIVMLGQACVSRTWRCCCG